jgi:hypothetical protein
MGLPSTTQKTIREALVPIIRAIVPTFTEYSDYLWTDTQDIEPRGSDLRTFKVYTSPGTVDPDGVYGGDGLEMVCELRIRVAYGGLDDNPAWDLITADGIDLWTALHPSPGGLAQTIAGFISLDLLEIEGVDIADDEDPTNLVIDFVSELHYKAAF